MTLKSLIQYSVTIALVLLFMPFITNSFLVHVHTVPCNHKFKIHTACTCECQLQALACGYKIYIALYTMYTHVVHTQLQLAHVYTRAFLNLWLHGTVHALSIIFHVNPFSFYLFVIFMFKSSVGFALWGLKLKK